MTAHERASKLATYAIDFELDPIARRELADHLAACTACRSFVAGIQGDAGQLRMIASRPAPLRVRVAIADAAATPVRAWSPVDLRASWLRFALVLALMAALIVGLVASSLFVGARPQLGVELSTPTPQPTEQTGLPGPIAAAVGQTITVCRDAGDLHAGSGALWFTCGTDLWRADVPAGTSALMTRGVGAVAITPDAVWTVGSGGVTRVTPQTGAVVTLVTVLGGTAVTADATSVWVANTSAGTVTRIDPATNRVVATIDVGTDPVGMLIADGAVWVTDRGSNTVTRIDPATNRVAATIPVGTGPLGIAAAAGSIWIVNNADGTVSRIDEATNTARTIALDPTTSSSLLPSIAALPDGSVWVVDSHRETLIELDPATDSVVRQLSVASAVGQQSLDSLAVLDGSLWVVDLSGSLFRVEIP